MFQVVVCGFLLVLSCFRLFQLFSVCCYVVSICFGLVSCSSCLRLFLVVSGGFRFSVVLFWYEFLGCSTLVSLNSSNIGRFKFVSCNVWVT